MGGLLYSHLTDLGERYHRFGKPRKLDWRLERLYEGHPLVKPENVDAELQDECNYMFDSLI